MGAISPVTVEARFYRRTKDGYRCGLCPHGCLVPVGGYGRCGSRRGGEEVLEAYTYGRVSSIAVDPMEKKPLYHFRPGSRVFSLGGIGCNMTCRHCQNYAISQSASGKKRTTFKSAREIAAMCRAEGTDCIAFTYNEPAIWFEYIMDVMGADPDLGCVIVSNGFIEEAPLRELCSVADAFNIDVKGFDEEFYRSICGGELDSVLRSLRIIHEEGVHLELTYLIIPGYNDGEEEISGFCRWVLENLSADIPVHFTRFHPDNEMSDVPWTPEETMLWARRTAMGMGLRYVYLGNIITEDGGKTFCPGCGAVAIDRIGYRVDASGLTSDGRCASCGADLSIVR